MDYLTRLHSQAQVTYFRNLTKTDTVRRQEDTISLWKKLEKARQEWNQKDIERQEKVAALRRERSDADADFKNINKALKDYEKVTTLVFEGKKFTRQPHIWDFYDPSDEMKEYMTLSIGAMGLVGGWTGQKIIYKLLF